MARRQRKVHLPDQADVAWDRVRGGVRDTVMAMAGLAAFESLSAADKHEITTLCAHVHEERGLATWADVEAWIGRVRRQYAAADLVERHAKQAAKPPRARRGARGA